jgi:hypothetical protein
LTFLFYYCVYAQTLIQYTSLNRDTGHPTAQRQGRHVPATTAARRVCRLLDLFDHLLLSTNYLYALFKRTHVS